MWCRTNCLSRWHARPRWIDGCTHPKSTERVTKRVIIIVLAVGSRIHYWWPLWFSKKKNDSLVVVQREWIHFACVYDGAAATRCARVTSPVAASYDATARVTATVGKSRARISRRESWRLGCSWRADAAGTSRRDVFTGPRCRWCERRNCWRSCSARTWRRRVISGVRHTLGADRGELVMC